MTGWNSLNRKQKKIAIEPYIDVLGRVSDMSIAEELGSPLSYVYKARTSRGIPAYKKPAPRLSRKEMEESQHHRFINSLVMQM